MKIPYVKEALLICVGLNLSFFILSMVMNNSSGAWLALASGVMCVFGLWFRSTQEGDDDSQTLS